MSNRAQAINTLFFVVALLARPALAQQVIPGGPSFQCARFFSSRDPDVRVSSDWNGRWLEAIELARIAIQMHPHAFPGTSVVARTTSAVNVESILNGARASRGSPLRAGVTLLRRLGAWSGHQNWRAPQDIPLEIRTASSRAFIALLLASAWAPETVYRLAVLNLGPGFQRDLPPEVLRELHSSLADLDPTFPGFASHLSENYLRAYARFNSETTAAEGIRRVLELPLPLRLRHLAESIAPPAPGRASN